MKNLLLTVILLFGLCVHQLSAQSYGGPNGHVGFQVFKVHPSQTSQVRQLTGRKPLLNYNATQSLKLKNGFEVGADVTLQKNTLKYDNLRALLLEVYHISAPVYVDYYLDPSCFVECGAYVGLQANSGNVERTEFVQWKHIQEVDLNWDAGFVAGVGIDIRSLGKIRLRYNHGLSKIVPLNKNTTVKNRVIEMGMTIEL